MFKRIIIFIFILLFFISFFSCDSDDSQIINSTGTKDNNTQLIIKTTEKPNNILDVEKIKKGIELIIRTDIWYDSISMCGTQAFLGNNIPYKLYYQEFYNDITIILPEHIEFDEINDDKIDAYRRYVFSLSTNGEVYSEFTGYSLNRYEDLYNFEGSVIYLGEGVFKIDKIEKPEFSTPTEKWVEDMVRSIKKYMDENNMNELEIGEYEIYVQNMQRWDVNYKVYFVNKNNKNITFGKTYYIDDVESGKSDFYKLTTVNQDDEFYCYDDFENHIKKLKLDNAVYFEYRVEKKF